MLWLEKFKKKVLYLEFGFCLEFYGPVNTIKVILTTLFLGMLSPQKVNQYLCTFFFAWNYGYTQQKRHFMKICSSYLKTVLCMPCFCPTQVSDLSFFFYFIHYGWFRNSLCKIYIPIWIWTLSGMQYLHVFTGAFRLYYSYRELGIYQVSIFSCFFLKTYVVTCDRAPWRHASYEYPQHLFSWRKVSTRFGQK